MLKYSFYIFVSSIFILIFSKNVYCIDIVLDGSFDDWSDKPVVTDKTGDGIEANDIVDTRWYANTIENRLYIYLSSYKKSSTWTVDVYITGDLGTRRATAIYSSKSEMVTLSLYDDKNNYLCLKNSWFI
jgi:hypothetical protein